MYLLAYKHPEVVRIAVFFGAGAFDVACLLELQGRRLAALSVAEQLEYRQMIELLKTHPKQ